MLNLIIWNRNVFDIKPRTRLNWVNWKRPVLTINCMDKNYTHTKLNSVNKYFFD